VTVNGTGTSITTTFNIAFNAALGLRDVSVKVGTQTSNSVQFTVTPLPPPTLISISPVTGPQNTTVSVTLTGTGFVAGQTAVIVSGTGITVGTVTVNTTGTSITTTFAIAAGASLGARNVTVNVGGQTSNPVVFTVTPAPSTIPFGSFDCKKINIELHGNHGNKDDDDDKKKGSKTNSNNSNFEFDCTFKLGSGSNGINPVNELTTISIGNIPSPNAKMTIPPKSFKQDGKSGNYSFEGTTAEGIKVEVNIKSLGSGSYRIQVEGKNANLNGVHNPVTIQVMIGDDNGSVTMNAKIHSGDDDDDHDNGHHD